MKTANLQFFSILLFCVLAIPSYSVSANDDTNLSSMSISTNAFVQKLRKNTLFSIGLSGADQVWEMKRAPAMKESQFNDFSYRKRTPMRGLSLSFGKDFNLNGYFSTTSLVSTQYYATTFLEEKQKRHKEPLKTRVGRIEITQALNYNFEALEMIIQPFIEIGSGITASQSEFTGGSNYQFDSRDLNHFYKAGLGFNFIGDKGIYSFLKFDLERQKSKRRRTIIVDNTPASHHSRSKFYDKSSWADYDNYNGMIGFGFRF